MYDSIFTRDYPVLLGILLLVSVTVIVVNLLTDIAYALLDPRVRY
jgi:ABC-type dipeptide/oligopeptide/nickel transport system permease component